MVFNHHDACWSLKERTRPYYYLIFFIFRSPSEDLVKQFHLLPTSTLVTLRNFIRRRTYFFRVLKCLTPGLTGWSLNGGIMLYGSTRTVATRECQKLFCWATDKAAQQPPGEWQVRWLVWVVFCILDTVHHLLLCPTPTGWLTDWLMIEAVNKSPKKKCITGNKYLQKNKRQQQCLRVVVGWYMYVCIYK